MSENILNAGNNPIEGLAQDINYNAQRSVHNAIGSIDLKELGIATLGWGGLAAVLLGGLSVAMGIEMANFEDYLGNLAIDSGQPLDVVRQANIEANLAEESWWGNLNAWMNAQSSNELAGELVLRGGVVTLGGAGLFGINSFLRNR